MSGWTIPRWTAVACSLAFGQLLAQEQGVGMVRVSDHPKAGVQPAGLHKHGGYAGMDTSPCPECHGVGCPHCHGHGCLLGNCLAGKFREHYCTNAPDYGYSIPGKYPIERRGVQYVNYFPAAWYGSGAAAPAVAYPMVYQPTDTTQLGFYYQHVPFWMPQPNPLPQRPIPAQWHNYAPAVPASAFHSGAWRGYAFDAAYCPVMESTPTMGTPVPPSPQPLQPVPSEDPPAPRTPVDESAVETPFQRAGLHVEVVPVNSERK